MSNIQIPGLPAVTALSGAELFEGVQSGSSVKISLAQVLAAAATGTSTALPFQVSVGGTGADNASGARTNLGLGTIAIQDANTVAITGGGINGTSIGGTTPAAGSFSTVTATSGIGYATGAGVAVTQLTSRTTPTPTTGNKTSGAITLFSAAGVTASWTTFTVPNTAILATDTVTVTIRGGTNTYIAVPSTIIAGTSFAISFISLSGTATDEPIVNFNIIRGVSA